MPPRRFRINTEIDADVTLQPLNLHGLATSLAVMLAQDASTGFPCVLFKVSSNRAATPAASLPVCQTVARTMREFDVDRFGDLLRIRPPI